MASNMTYMSNQEKHLTYMYLKLLKPVYGLSQSGDSLFHKNIAIYFLMIQLNLSTTDDAFFFYYKHYNTTRVLQDTIPVCFHDIFGSGNAQF